MICSNCHSVLRAYKTKHGLGVAATKKRKSSCSVYVAQREICLYFLPFLPFSVSPARLLDYKQATTASHDSHGHLSFDFPRSPGLALSFAIQPRITTLCRCQAFPEGPHCATQYTPAAPGTQENQNICLHFFSVLVRLASSLFCLSANSCSIFIAYACVTMQIHLRPI
jgi:hypothetical protein